jgi:thiol-disulfide isomerase/thioredoxin
MFRRVDLRRASRRCMRSWALALLLLLSLVLPTATAGAPTPTEAGMLFGGQGGAVANGSSSTIGLDAMPPVLEDYTATWCENCVYVEHALYDLMEERDGHVFSFHRSIGEVEDPFGTQELDERWEERYSRRAPPTVVFNGSTMVIGSIPEGESLLEDFRALANQSLDLPEGASTFSWTSATSGSTTVTWSISGGALDGHAGMDVVLNVELWIVEETARFPEGSNGEEDYPHIVRQIVPLDSQPWSNSGVASSGAMEINLPPPFDGNDLSVHLVYALQSTAVDDLIDPSPEPSKRLPGPGATVVLLALAVAARNEA